MPCCIELIYRIRIYLFKLAFAMMRFITYGEVGSIPGEGNKTTDSDAAGSQFGADGTVETSKISVFARLYT